jgi:sugar phosphate isomerase/epimerase
MSSRRRFLTALASGIGAAALKPLEASAPLPPEVKSSLGGAIGLQLYSVRDDLEKDIPGTLARLRSLGVREVENAGLAGQTVEAFRAALDKADLVCRSSHIRFERVRDDMAGAVEEAKALGGKYVVCPSVPHDEKRGFTREDASNAAVVFNEAGRRAKDEGLRFGYHPHGYEYAPASDGTLFETIAAHTDPALVSFEIDIFWAKAGGADPAEVIASLPGRVPLLHVKDMAKGLSLPPGSSGAPKDTNVVAGEGQLDLPAILRAARKSGTEIFFVEDESSRPWEQIPRSLAYLSGLRLS